MHVPVLQIDPSFTGRLKSLGLDSLDRWFTDERINVWRTLSDRENATLDLTADANHPAMRLHVKRYHRAAAVRAELRGHQLTTTAGVPTATLVAHGIDSTGRGVIAFADMAGYTPADKIIRSPDDFEALLQPTAELAAQLHRARLHHRDLYLCHFMVRPEPFDIRLIDTARVGPMSNPLTRRRWIVKDLAQFFFSTTRHGISDGQRSMWFNHYTRHCGGEPRNLLPDITAKVAHIARHDQKLNERQPRRNVSIPS